jgi:isopentenyl diphosphate isomerase/L-lactate dehydrogenase-like FMN-dependent dehydrogenase
MQHSSRCSGSAISRERSTSSTVISRTLRMPMSASPATACGLRMACRRVVTAISASCSGVVPYCAMCRRATIA